MAIRIIEGVPGSGKTYFAVHHLLTKYFDYDKTLDEYKKKPEFSSLVIVTNIDNFPFATSLDSLIEKAGSTENFFTYAYQENLSNGVPYVYLIDEVQSLFPYTYRDTRVFLFFQKHRHLGMDIYLITQDADHLAKGLRSLAEFHIVAGRRSLSVFGELRYRFVDPQTKECWNTKVLKKDGRIFSFYKSFSSLETESSPSIPRRFALLFGAGLLVILLVGYFGFYKRLVGRHSLDDPSAPNSSVSTSSSSIASSSGVASPRTAAVASSVSSTLGFPSSSLALSPGVARSSSGVSSSSSSNSNLNSSSVFSSSSGSLPGAVRSSSGVSSSGSPGLSPSISTSSNPLTSFPRFNYFKIAGIFSSPSFVLTYLVDLGSSQLRVNADEMTSLCRCHPEFVHLGSVFQIDETTAPPSALFALRQGTPPIQSAGFPGVSGGSRGF
jgi:hypothetical protein